ncbi:flavoprotein [Archangium lansingense]|uniref:flavoprotein n=1 Tax=Archangium lansingense TaxID=2995310 RepID=UPI003B76B616
MANILLAATGGTRAPTQVELCERFLRDGHSVRLVASTHALRFIGAYMARKPLKLPMYLRHYRPAFRETLAYFVEKPREVPHIAEGKWADVAVIAPATCNSLGKLVSGISDSYLLLILRALPRTKKVIVVPSMNPEMWYDPHFQRNIDLLNATDKYCVLCPRRGPMLSGDWGIGAQVPIEVITTATYRALGLRKVRTETLSGDPHANGVTRLAWVRSAWSLPEAFRVVLVEPDGKGRRALMEALRHEYPMMDLQGFATATRALEWLKQHPASVVLTELDFPRGLSGLELIQSLRRTVHEPVHIIATSTRDRRVAGAERLARLDVLFIPKPLNLTFVAGMIAGLVRQAV